LRFSFFFPKQWHVNFPRLVVFACCPDGADKHLPKVYVIELPQ
jgi:hypothetical protein